MQPLDRIVSDPEVCMGQPVIRGTRITLGVILRLMAGGKTIADVIAAYPELTQEDVQQALRYAAWAVSDEQVLINVG